MTNFAASLVNPKRTGIRTRMALKRRFARARMKEWRVTLGSSFASKIPLPFCKSTSSATFVTNPVPERASVILPTNAARPLNANEGHSPQEVSLVCFSQSKLRASTKRLRLPGALTSPCR
jgi:hypothetical protein